MAESQGIVGVVDISKCETTELLADAIQDAMKQSGFLFFTNHGLESRVEKLFEISEAFFIRETEEEKDRCAYTNNRGYTRVSQEILDPTKPAPDLKEGFNIGFIEAGPPAKPTHALPETMMAHIETLASFQSACFELCQRLLTAFAHILDFFAENHTHSVESDSILRFLHYPAVEPGKQVSPNRAGAHSDYGSLTLLFQRSSGGEGLQILPSSEPLDSTNWIPTGVVENALLVNIGDALELWSGAIFKSTLHRVVLPTPLPVEGIPERFSIAWFNQPTPSASLKTVVPTSQITEHDFARMERKGVTPGKDVTAAEHLRARLDSTYKQARPSAS